jgi:hypothetical protein
MLAALAYRLSGRVSSMSRQAETSLLIWKTNNPYTDKQRILLDFIPLHERRLNTYPSTLRPHSLVLSIF